MQTLEVNLCTHMPGLCKEAACSNADQQLDISHTDPKSQTMGP